LRCFRLLPGLCRRFVVSPRLDPRFRGDGQMLAWPVAMQQLFRGVAASPRWPRHRRRCRNQDIRNAESRPLRVESGPAALGRWNAKAAVFIESVISSPKPRGRAKARAGREPADSGRGRAPRVNLPARKCAPQARRSAPGRQATRSDRARHSVKRCPAPALWCARRDLLGQNR
jgi:hypothetical protein